MAKVEESGQEAPAREQGHRAHKHPVRSALANGVRVVLLLFAVVLALAAFLVAAQDIVVQDNGVVVFIFDAAELIAGPFGREDGIFAFTGANADIKDAVVNWGIGALVYLLIGRYAQRLLAPRSHS